MNLERSIQQTIRVVFLWASFVDVQVALNAQSALLMDERIIVSFDQSELDNAGPFDTAEATTDEAATGRQSLRVSSTMNPLDGHGTFTDVWIGDSHPALGGPLAESTSESRDLNRFFTPAIRFQYKVSKPLRGTSTLHLALGFRDDGLVESANNEAETVQLMASGTATLINNGQWASATINLSVLPGPERKALDLGAPSATDIPEVLRIVSRTTQPHEFFIDNVELLTLPAIERAVPWNDIFHDPSKGIEIHVKTGSHLGLPADGIQWRVNGEDLSTPSISTNDGLTRLLRWDGLTLNEIYEIELSIEDSNGLERQWKHSFDTFDDDSVFTFEAEDFNFAGGQYFNEPVLSNTPAGFPGSYFDTVGIQGIDRLDVDREGPALENLDRVYRYGTGFEREEWIATVSTDDFLRTVFSQASPNPSPIQDYHLGWSSPGEWANYTRDFPPGIYHLYARMKNDGAIPYTVKASLVLGDPSTLEQTVRTLGSFEDDVHTWKWVPLLDDAGDVVTLELEGKTTLRMTQEHGHTLFNCYLLKPVDSLQPSLPTLSISRHRDNDILLEWVGSAQLESATKVDGPWQIESLSAPVNMPPVGAMKFFRLRR